MGIHWCCEGAWMSMREVEMRFTVTIVSVINAF